jgi:hypothetical protein
MSRIAVFPLPANTYPDLAATQQQLKARSNGGQFSVPLATDSR